MYSAIHINEKLEEVGEFLFRKLFAIVLLELSDSS